MHKREETTNDIRSQESELKSSSDWMGILSLRISLPNYHMTCQQYPSVIFPPRIRFICIINSSNPRSQDLIPTSTQRCGTDNRSHLTGQWQRP